MYPHVQGNSTYNSQDVGTTYMPLDGCMAEDSTARDRKRVCTL